MTRTLLVMITAAVAIGCASGAPSPVRFDAAHEPCRFCRMVGSNGRFAAQIVTPRDEPLFFDDIGCLRGYVMGRATWPTGTATFVVDHALATWIRSDRAVYTRNDALETPMGSHLLAHESPASRDRDPAARPGTDVPFSQVFAGVVVPGGGS